MKKALFPPELTNLFKGQFARNALISFSGSAAGQAIVILAMPLITRLYSPSDFGVFAVFSSILYVLGVIASLRYEQAIPLPDQESIAYTLVYLSFIFVFCISLISVISLYLFNAEISSLLNPPHAMQFIWFLPLGLLTMGWYQILSSYAVRRKNFRLIAKTKLAQGCSLAMLQLGFGVLNFGPMGLILGLVFSPMLGSILVLKLFFQKSRDKQLNQVSFQDLSNTAIRYIKFPIYSGSSALLNSSGLYLPPVLLAILYGSNIAGIFSLTQRVISMPINLVGASIAQVYLSQAPKMLREDPEGLYKLFINIAKKLLLISLIPTFVIVAIAPDLFDFTFGKEWRMAGVFVQVMSPAMVAQFVVSPLSTTLIVAEKQELQIGWDASRLILVSLSIYFANYFNMKPEVAVFIYSFVLTLLYLMLFLMLKGVVKRIADRKTYLGD